jgi:hypothetical protein
MDKKKNKYPTTDFRVYLNEELKNPEFKRMFDEFGIQLEVTCQINKLRLKRKLSLSAFAKKLGISRQEVDDLLFCNKDFTIQFLAKIVIALGAELKIALK